MTDLEIVSLVLEGDKEKYSLLVGKYQKMVFTTCLGYVHNKDDADDLTQDVFINAYQGLSKFKGKSEFSTWLFRIAINAGLNHVRKKESSGILTRIVTVFSRSGINEQVIEVKDPTDPELSFIKNEELEKLRKAIDKLPDKQRTALVLSRYDELSQREIADIMEITEGAVEALIQRAKKNLSAVMRQKK